MTSDFMSALEKAKREKLISEKFFLIFLDFYLCYKNAITAAGLSMSDYEDNLTTYLSLSLDQMREPCLFQPYHQAITTPFDYYAFGLEFLRPLVDIDKSRVFHMENVEKMEKELDRGENVILLSNHQSEADPPLISLALEKEHGAFAKKIIYVAGDRVVTDPMAIPISLGRNLLCIYSKRHIENPPEKKREKLLHNQKTMQLLKELLSQGNKCIYMAPSGGRDRPNEQGIVEPAPFDANSIELFRLIASAASKKTHFYPLSIATYDILPPPRAIESEIGEKRVAKRTSILISFGDEIDFSAFNSLAKKERREAIAKMVHTIVLDEYWKMKKETNPNYDQ